MSKPELLAAHLRSLEDHRCNLAADALEAQAREIEGLRKDAERYRWLREPSLAAGQGSITVELDDRANGHFSRSIFLAELDAARARLEKAP